ncbi:MAG: type VI secretion system tip protein VgrG [Deltaproteobacteria bacterium]|nr:type VI secretion system tip protein VgrG [Deltaproteobacteria bacterium]
MSGSLKWQFPKEKCLSVLIAADHLPHGDGGSCHGAVIGNRSKIGECELFAGGVFPLSRLVPETSNNMIEVWGCKMPYLTEKKFDFVSHAAGLDADTFGVVRFKGTEGFSLCYEFEIDLVSLNAEIDLTAVLKNPATFTILRDTGDIPFHGILARFDQLHEMDGFVFYRALLVPKLWWLSLTHHNQVLLNRTVPRVIEEVLKDGGLTTLDFELKLEKEYTEWEYICQYGESHLNFVSRWMEREGLYYYFEQNENGEKIIITDTKLAHTEISYGKTMYYSPPSGLDDAHREEIIKGFICRQKMIPRTLNLKDYNYATPSLEISGNAEVSPHGRGNIYMYGDHFRTMAEGNQLAKIWAEGLRCQERQFHGESTIPYLRSGYLFDLEEHYRADMNRGYLTIEIRHEGSQASFLIAGIQKGLAEVEKQPYYRNSFVAIPADIQFRPERKTEKSRFHGIISARIDAAGTGKYAELDDHGRYKVVLPLDLSGRKDGKASAYFRMSQPYAGSDHGMHFPLHKGTEVLLTFIDGDPDRPIIQGAVPNPETPSVVNAANATMAGIQTGGGNQIHMEDSEGHERIVMSSGSGKSLFKIGAGSEDEASLKSSCIATSCDFVGAEMSGLAKSIGSMVSTSTLTGVVKFQLMKQVVDNFFKKVPKLWESRAKGGLKKGIGGWSMVVYPIGKLIQDIAIKKLIVKLLTGKMKKGVSPKDLLGKYDGGEYCYTVVCDDDATYVEQQSPIDMKDKTILVAAVGATGGMLEEAGKGSDPGTSVGKGVEAGVGVLLAGLPKQQPKGIFMGTKNGSILLYGEEDIDGTANRNILFDAKELKSTTVSEKGKTSFVGNLFSARAKTGVEISTNATIDDFTSGVHHKKDPEGGISIVAGGVHDIKIKQDGGNVTGTILTESKKKVTVKVGDNTITIDDQKNITVDAGTKVELKVGSNTVTVGTGSITVKSSEVEFDVGATNAKLAAGSITMKSGGGVTISGTGTAEMKGSQIMIG